ncbi:MAG: 3-isopropylmalate dehydrogenase [bacterium]
MKTVVLLPGDGIGPEITEQARRVLDMACYKADLEVVMLEGLIGGDAIDVLGHPFPEQTQSLLKGADGVLLGAVGGPKWADSKLRPEQGLLDLRRHLNVFANIRPVKVFPELLDSTPIKTEYLEGVDLVFVRELTGGIYFGEKTREKDSASDLCTYYEHEVERVVRKACDLAMQRRKKVTSIDKANVLETSRLWRSVTDRIVGEEYPEIELEVLLVDAAAMHLLSRPKDFDVLVTENMFGDILTDEASMLAGSLGLLPSASLGESHCGLYEPIHGSAPDIAGQNCANPIGTILSAAMLARHSLKSEAVASNIEHAVAQVVTDGQLTIDLSPANPLSTSQVGDAVIAAL